MVLDVSAVPRKRRLVHEPFAHEEVVALAQEFSSTCSSVRDTARLLRLGVKSFGAKEFCHMPNVWHPRRGSRSTTNSPRMRHPLRHLANPMRLPRLLAKRRELDPLHSRSARAPRTDRRPLTFQCRVRPSLTSIPFAIIFLIPPHKHAPCTSVSIQILPACIGPDRTCS